jgi:hypothetical protein
MINVNTLLCTLAMTVFAQPVFASSLSEDARGNIKTLHIRNEENNQVRVSADGIQMEHGPSQLELIGEVKCSDQNSWFLINQTSQYQTAMRKAGIEKNDKICSFQNVDMDLDNIEISVYKLIGSKCDQNPTLVLLPLKKNDLVKGIDGLCDYKRGISSTTEKSEKPPATQKEK